MSDLPSYGSTLTQTRVPAARHSALLLAVLIGLGVSFARWLEWSAAQWACLLILALGPTVWLLVRTRNRRPLIGMSLLAGLLAVSIGGLRYTAEVTGRPDSGIVELANSGKIVELFGRVDGSPRRQPSGWRVPVKLTSLRTRSGISRLDATVLLTARRKLDSLSHNDFVRFPARLQLPHSRRNPGGFDYSDHLFNQGIDALARPAGAIVRIEPPGVILSLHRLADPVRAWMRDTFTRHLSKLPRTLILGFLIGEIGDLPTSVYRTVRDAGALHLVAVSGANVWLVVGMILLPLRVLRVPRWPRTVILLTVVIVFSFLARNEPSVVRASLMIATLLVGALMFRPVRALNAIGTAAVIILLSSPSHLFRPGFQLSFAAVIAIILVTSSVRYWSHQPRTRWGRWVLMLCLSTVAATVATAPIIAWHFGRVPIVSLPANLLMVPVASLSVYLGVAVLLIDPIWTLAASLLAIPLSWLLNACVTIASVFASLPVAVIHWPNPSPFLIVIVYTVFLGFLNWRHRYVWIRPFVYLGVGTGSVLLTLQLWSESPPTLRLGLLDAGQHRLATVNASPTDVIWISSASDGSEGLNEWVIEPFQVALQLSPDTLQIHDWQTQPVPTRALHSDHTRHHDAIKWERYISGLDSQLDVNQVWMDRFEVCGFTAVLVRGIPTARPTSTWFRLAHNASVVILPSNAPRWSLRDFLQVLTPPRVVFYGNDIPSRYPSDWLEDWQAHFPAIEFWATPVHGGLLIEFREDELRIIPTIANQTWIDAAG